MEKYKIGKETIAFYGKQKGSNTNKFNRVAKLAAMYNDLNKKLLGMVLRGENSCTETYRCAVALLLIMETGIRVGNEGSAEGYHTVPHPNAKNQESKFVKTYGLTTLLQEHVTFLKPKKMFFNFVGKKQVENTFEVPSNLVPYVYKIWLDCKKDPVFGITDYQLTKFIKRYVGKQFTPKDFRTLRANIYAHQTASTFFEMALRVCKLPAKKKDFNESVKTVCEAVAQKLNNTSGVCKKSYIDDMLFAHYAEKFGVVRPSPKRQRTVPRSKKRRKV